MMRRKKKEEAGKEGIEDEVGGRRGWRRGLLLSILVV